MKVSLSDALVDHVDYFEDSIWLTIDELRKMHKEVSDPIKRAKIVHADIDQWIKSEAERRGQITCRKGCTDCCSGDVMATNDEIELIKSYLDGKFPEDDGKQCPFLKDGLCSIYPVRPGACRKLVSTSFPCTLHLVVFPAEVIWSAAVTVNGGKLIHKVKDA